MEKDLPTAEPLNGDLDTDVLIVGGGIAGLSCAFELAGLGRKVALVERGNLAGGMSARTSAHLTFETDDYYKELIRLHGHAQARQYYESQRAAVDRIEEIAAQEGIACDFQRVDGFLFARDGDDGLLDDEWQATQEIGWRGVERLPSVLGLATGPAVRFPDQARFHPLKYLSGLIGALRRKGVQLYGHTPVTSVEERERVVAQTEGGATILANEVVIATNSPIIDLLTIHPKQAPYRTYVIAAKVEKGRVPDALIWDTEEPYHYVRLQPAEDCDFLIVGGEDHKSGEAQDGQERVNALHQWANKVFGAIGPIEYAWSGQVYEPVDAVPFIGLNPGNHRVYVITGDSGEGLTSAVAGSLIIKQLVRDRSCTWAEVYDPARKRLKAAGEFARENADVVADMAEHLSGGDVDDPSKIPAGHGALIRLNGEKTAAFRDEQGKLHLVSATCTHAGCVVHFNPFERCWDCSCHGSQFDIEGHVLAGPALHPLKQVED